MTSSDLRELSREHWGERKVADVMHPTNGTAISPNTDARQALSIMRKTQNSRLMVTGVDGRLEGLVTPRDLMQFLSLKLDLGIEEEAPAGGS